MMSGAGRAAMDEIGILPQFRGKLVRDGYQSYSWYEQCQHGLCNSHLLRDFQYIEEVSPAQKVWIEPLRKLLLETKEAAQAAHEAGEKQLSKRKQSAVLRRYAELVREAEKLNPALEQEQEEDPAKEKQTTQLTPRKLINRLQKKGDEILRFMTDLTVPFDNNGSERDLRMVKLSQKISGCFRTEDGARQFCRIRSYLSTARKQGYAPLCSLERALVGKPLSFGPAVDAQAAPP